MTDKEMRREYYARRFTEAGGRRDSVVDLVCIYLQLDRSIYFRLAMVGPAGYCFPYLTDARLDRVVNMYLNGRPLAQFMRDLDRWQAAASC